MKRVARLSWAWLSALVLVLPACGGARATVATAHVPAAPAASVPPPVPTTPAVPKPKPVPPPPAPAPPPRLPRPAPLPPAPPPLPGPIVDGCPADMAPVGGFCIDRYEAPNAEGERPYALQTAYDGEKWCAAHGKRLCTEDEWVRACRGSHERKYPYGNTFRYGVCNDNRTWIDVDWKKLATWPNDTAVEEASRLYQADPSGAHSSCVTEEGVFDMTGNVAEWVRKSAPVVRPGYEHVLKGCYWSGCYHDPHPSCGFANRAHPGTFRTYEAGFRCCRPRVNGR